MTATVPPRPYPEWRAKEIDRAEDAAYAFGHDLIVHCREEALREITSDTTAATRAIVEKAVDVALHNVMDLLEGLWPLPSGPTHSLAYALQVRITDAGGKVIETQEISPARLDLPIGYWKWSRDREFR